MRAKTKGAAAAFGSAALTFAFLLAGLGAGCRSEPASPHGGSGRHGGRLVAALRSEPATLNPAVAVNHASLTVIRSIGADLIHINRRSQTTEPALAEEWSVSEDGLRYTLHLRHGVRFSDGEPFDADDVLFSFQVYLDPAVQSPQRSLLTIGGEPIRLRKLGPYTVEAELAAPYAAGERLFDSMVILPEHRLRRAYESGRLAAAWDLATEPEEIVGLGPFRLREYRPGQRITLERNPYYWKTDEGGEALPYLDELVFLFVATEDAQVVRFQAGEIDVIDRLSAEHFATLQKNGGGEDHLLRDLGPGLDYSFLFFNLNDLTGKDLPGLRAKQDWFRSLEFRRAVSAAIDRRALVELVYHGRATPLSTHVTPGNQLWRNDEIPPPSHSYATARSLLRTAGFSQNGTGILLGPEGHPVEFSLITSSSNSKRLQMATVIQEDLRRVGMRVQVVPLEHRALVERVLETEKYEASLLSITPGDADPNGDANVWLSGGDLHFWNLGQSEPSTEWEAEIDRLLRRQMTTLDYRQRKELYDQVQRLVAEHLPLIFLTSPNVLVAARGDLENFKPAVMDHHTLWNVEELYLGGGGRQEP